LYPGRNTAWKQPVSAGCFDKIISWRLIAQDGKSGRMPALAPMLPRAIAENGMIEAACYKVYFMRLGTYSCNQKSE
jgi:hypothetical protein